MAKIRTYSEMIRFHTFKERFEYLRLFGNVAETTFGVERYLNQQFYKSDEWLEVRDYVIYRDNGCDLGIPDREIKDSITIHHMNPILVKDIIEVSDILLDPEMLVSTTSKTHKFIHYGKAKDIFEEHSDRFPGDTCLW